MQDRLNEVQKIINGYFDSVESEAFGRFRADFSFGKMLRSKLLLTIAPNSPIAPKVCAIIELIHFASLLHDDVIDSAHLRRGKQSINAKYGDKNAIMLGDILYSKAFYEIACVSCGGANLAQIISNAVYELSLGELDDVFLGEKINLDSQKYLAMVARKTAALIEASAICGGILKNENSLGNSSLGASCVDLANFECSQTPSLVSHSKFAKNTTTSTANTRICDLNQGDSNDSAESSLRGVANAEAIQIYRHTERSEVSKSCESKINNESMTKERINESHKFAQSKKIENNSKVAKMDSSRYALKNDDIVDCHESPQSAVSQKDNAQIEKYKIYGRNLGIAFQIIDDLLDITQEDSTLGKESFSDFKEGKTTLPYIYLYNALNANDKEILKSYFKKPLDSAQKGWIRDKMSEFEIIQKVKNVAQDYGKMALSMLDSSDTSDKNLLKIITDMIDREF